MKNLIVILCLFISVSAFGSVKGKRYMVVSDTALLYRHYLDNDSSFQIDMGASFIVEDEKNNKLKFIYQNKMFWIDKKNVHPVDINVKNFAMSSSLYVGLPVTNEEQFLFIYKNGLYRMDLNNPQDPQIILSASVPHFSDVSASSDGSLLLLIGDVVTDFRNNLNMALYNTRNRNFIPLTTFDGNSVTLNSSFFSRDNKFLILFFSKNDTNIVHIYDIAKKELVLMRKDISDVVMIENMIFIYDEKTLDSYNLNRGFNESTVLHHFKKGDNLSVQSTLIGKNIYFQINNTIYLLTNNSLEKSRLKSLDRSLNGTIEYSNQQDQILVTYNGKRLRSLSGAKPRWTFLSILDEHRLVYRQQKDALQIINIYDGRTDESFPYYWIEDPIHIFQNGVAIESVEDDERIFIFLEKSGEWVKMINLNEVLK